MSNIMKRQDDRFGRSVYGNALFTALVCSSLLLAKPSFATIDNTVTVRGTPPGGPADSVVATDSETVDVVDAINDLTIVKTANLNDEVTANGFAEAGETITYTFDITNTGNVTITNITVPDTTNATNGPVVPGSEAIFNDVAPLTDSIDAATDGVWDSIAPGDTVRFSATYTVTQQDVDTLQ